MMTDAGLMLDGRSIEPRRSTRMCEAGYLFLIGRLVGLQLAAGSDTAHIVSASISLAAVAAALRAIVLHVRVPKIWGQPRCGLWHTAVLPWAAVLI